MNEEIAEIFDRMSRVLAFKGKDRFRALAYERAAGSLRSLDQDLEALARAGKLEEMPGIGHDLSQLIEEYIQTGRIRRCEQESRGIPNELIEMMDIPGLGPKTLALLHQKYRVKTIEDLKRLITDGKLKKLRRFGEKKIENLRRGIALWQSSKQRMPLGLALPLAENLIDVVRKIPQVEHADLAGSIRRRRETIGDIDMLIISRDSRAALREFLRLPEIKQVIARGETRATVIIEGGMQVDVRAVPRESYGAALQYFTGSKEHCVHLRTLALNQGVKLNEYGLFRGKKRLGGKDEEEVYRLLGLKVMPPELREDRGVIEAAIEKRLPQLVEFDDLRGELHTHTTWSDGRSSIEEMVEKADSLRYEYIALTDHSRSARVAHGLDLGRLEEKVEELEAVRKKRERRKPRILVSIETPSAF